jgi:hypothetical protein
VLFILESMSCNSSSKEGRKGRDTVVHNDGESGWIKGGGNEEEEEG